MCVCVCVWVCVRMSPCPSDRRLPGTASPRYPVFCRKANCFSLYRRRLKGFDNEAQMSQNLEDAGKGASEVTESWLRCARHVEV